MIKDGGGGVAKWLVMANWPAGFESDFSKNDKALCAYHRKCQNLYGNHFLTIIKRLFKKIYTLCVTINMLKTSKGFFLSGTHLRFCTETILFNYVQCTCFFIIVNIFLKDLLSRKI